MNSFHSVFLAVTSTFLLTSVAVAKPAFPSKIPYQGFSCSTCHDGSPGLASMNDFANDFKAAGNTWTKDLCEKDSDGDGASNGVELLDPECDWMDGDMPRSGEGAFKPSDATSKPEADEPMGGVAAPAGGLPVPGGANSALPTTPSGGSAASNGPAPSTMAGASATPANTAMGGVAASTSDGGGDSGGCSVSLTGSNDPLAILGLGAFALLAFSRRRR